MTLSPSATTDIEARLTRLEANEDLRRLAHEYCHGLDTRDLERFLAIWDEDCDWVLAGTSLRTHDEIRRATLGIFSTYSETHHWTTNHVVDWSGPKPRGMSEVTVMAREVDGQWTSGAATNVDTYACVDGRWVIQRREAILHFNRTLS